MVGLGRPQVREARPMCCVEHTFNLDRFQALMLLWPVSLMGHPVRRTGAASRAPGWLVRRLSRPSRPQVREARPMCCGERKSQVDNFGARVATWPVSPAGHPGRRPSASCRASGWLVRHLTRLSRPQVREARLMCCIEHTSQLDKCGLSPDVAPNHRAGSVFCARGWFVSLILILRC